MMREISEDKTDIINKTFSIQCTSKRNYDQLAEICKKPEIFNKVRKLIKQEKEEKIKKHRKELHSIDPEMEIKLKKNDQREHMTLIHI